MLLLVHAHGHQVGLIQQNIRGHEHGIGIQAGVDVVGMLGALVLELGHAVQLTHIGKAVQDPSQLRVAAHMALAINQALLRVQAAGQVNGHQLLAAAAQGGGVLPDGNGMHVHHAVDAIVIILQKGEIP